MLPVAMVASTRPRGSTGGWHASTGITLRPAPRRLHSATVAPEETEAAGALPQGLERIRRNWEAFGRTDPLWAILNDRDEGDWNAQEFFATGRVDVAWLLDEAAAAGAPMPRGRCLDFGCGVGRLTQALADHFESCDGVDIAQPMIEAARRHNQHGERCRYHVNVAGDLSLFEDGSFDGVVSIIVLQHIPAPFNRRYIAEFIRVLRPGGVAVFQVPAVHHADRLDAPRIHLADGAHRARLEAEAAAPISLAAGETATLSVRVTNISAVRWSGGRFLRLGNHWLSRWGRRRVCDDGRTIVPDGLGPGESAVIDITVTAPLRPGRHILELDLVEEGVCWFAERGSPTSRIPAVVTGSARPQPSLPARDSAAETSEQPEMEMHCIAADEVVQIVEQAGGRVVQAKEWPGITGPAWDSVRYIVVR
jgi:2-polyprenyl-3-methyl-5-hydroxy-6-metoxy-1,4-benzoquinol methylase